MILSVEPHTLLRTKRQTVSLSTMRLGNASHSSSLKVRTYRKRICCGQMLSPVDLFEPYKEHQLTFSLCYQRTRLFRSGMLTTRLKDLIRPLGRQRTFPMTSLTFKCQSTTRAWHKSMRQGDYSLWAQPSGRSDSTTSGRPDAPLQATWSSRLLKCCRTCYKVK